jgi:undecaprenyl-diphosphatase
METLRSESIPQVREGDWFRVLDQYELDVTRFFNQVGRLPLLYRSMPWISRSGDGVFWYTLMAAIFLFGGQQGRLVAIQMAVTAIVGVAVYKLLKNTLLRARPFITHPEICRLTAPLDYYSFPSGHTLHAVAFTLVSGAWYPMLLWVTFPFMLLVAMSRVLLGLHYPSDVMAGALIGAALASLSLSLF